MTKQLKFPLLQGESITLQGGFDGSAADLSLLARLVHIRECQEPSGLLPEVVWCKNLQDADSKGVCVFQSKSLNVMYDFDDEIFRVCLQDSFNFERQLSGIFLWHLSVICGALAALLRGRKVQLMHCSMLEKDNQALLLLGESGIGKSTSMRRWQESGGEAVADDMVLLEYLDGEIVVHRLPTWSACRIKLEGRVYAYDPPLQLKNVLAITRGEANESVQTISKAEYYAQLYRCGFFHYQPIAQNLPLPVQKKLAVSLRDFTAILTERFKPQAFFAHLDGDIRESLGDFL
jgi:hypothetical protein